MSSVFFSLAALKIFFLYLVFRSLNVFKGDFLIFTVLVSQNLLHLWVPVFQQIRKSLAIVSSKIFLLSHSVSSPSRTLDDILPNCLTLLHRLDECSVQSFFPVSLSFILGNFYWHVFKFIVLPLLLNESFSILDTVLKLQIQTDCFRNSHFSAEIPYSTILLFSCKDLSTIVNIPACSNTWIICRLFIYLCFLISKIWLQVPFCFTSSYVTEFVC